MKEYVNRLFTVLTTFIALIITGCIYEEGDDGIGDSDSDSIVTNVTFNSVTYRAEQSRYYVDPDEDALGFGTVFKSDETEPILFILYYLRNRGCESIADNVELGNYCIHIAFLFDVGEIKGWEASRTYTNIESGNVIAVSHKGGRGLQFNNLTFTTSFNPDETFVLNGTIYYDYTYLN